MKISKLFHWLYAILMFLPVLVFIPNAFYYGFNKEAIAQEKTELIPIYYESNEITQVNDIVVGNIYFYTNNFSTDYRPTNNVGIFNIDKSLFVFQYPQYDLDRINYISMMINPSGNMVLWIEGYNQTLSVNSREMYFIPLVVQNPTIIATYVLDYIQVTDFKFVKQYQPVTTNMSISDSMSYAWQSTWQSDLFSWSYASFLTQPFLYITNLFNVPATNTLLYCLSYWLNISIIWLVFDLIMYLPLLFHRWIDKGVLE